MSEHTTKRQWGSLAGISVATLLGVALLYLASVGPLWCIAGTSRQAPLGKFYEPVLLLMEESPLRRPLITWCGLWGCRDDVENHLLRRQIRNWGDDPSRVIER